MRKRIAVVFCCWLIFLGGFSTGGQEQSEKGQKQTPGFTPVTPKRKTPAKPSNWRMPDGRVVEFPASTSQEEIDALAKRIAEGTVELPPGSKVIGWEPVEGATSLLPEYEQRLATIPTAKGKLDALANAVGILQRQIIVLQIRLDAEHASNDAGFKSSDKTLNNHAEGLNVQAALLGSLANDVDRLKMKTNQLDDLKRELDDFKAAACPVLRNLRASGIKIDFTCGLL